VCRFKDLPAPLSDSYIRESECIEKRCGNFKDRSRLLPCKVGDTIYVVEKGKIIQDSVVTLYVAYFGGDEETFQFDGIKTNGYFSDFGKTVFLNREAAEQALKERE
jgi:hypothetical protein